MPIETICQNCARKLRVADEYAGKKARCPQCHTIYVVPGPSHAAAPTQPPETPASPFTPARGPERWRVRTPDGRVYGPVPKSELDQWVAEGRIPPQAALQIESTDAWRSASEVYLQLQRSGRLTASSNPFADLPTSPTVRSQATMYPQRSHRGVLILVFGILAWIVCPVFAPVAWIMGQGDLREMRRGAMDPSGMSLTQAGMILGMVYTILFMLFLVFVCLGSLVG
jgi:hypothetical protein